MLVAVAVMAATSGYFVAMVLNPAPASGPAPSQSLAAARASHEPEDLLGLRRPEFTLKDIDGGDVSASQFDDRVMLVNFWATWCKPCIEEMPMLNELQAEYFDRGVRVVGIAVDEVQQAREFTAGLGIGYVLLFGLADVMITGREYGNRSGMLPYSVLVDESGIIRWTHLGALDREVLIDQIERLL